MQDYCHRCGGELPARDGMSPFCPHCGSPQIYLQDYEQQNGGAEGDTTGGIPPPGVQEGGGEGARVAWLGVAWGMGGLVARYGLHSLGAFDAELTQMLHAQYEKATAMTPQPP